MLVGSKFESRLLSRPGLEELPINEWREIHSLAKLAYPKRSFEYAVREGSTTVVVFMMGPTNVAVLVRDKIRFEKRGSHWHIVDPLAFER